MRAVKDVIVAGNTIYVKEKHKRKKQSPSEPRAPRRSPTAEEIDKVNQRNAEKTLGILLNYNFKYQDYHLVLTYAGEEPSREQAKKDLGDFKRRLARLYKKHGITLKWIVATEYEDKRIHHHMVCTGGVDLAEIDKAWGCGTVRPRFLDKSGDYRRLAAYIIKETSKTFRGADAVSRHRYDPSKSIERPEVCRERVLAKDIHKDPKPIKGYYIDPESVYRGRNPFTGTPYLEYVMISLDDEPRIKKWRRGKKVRISTRQYKSGEQQLELMFSSCRHSE